MRYYLHVDPDKMTDEEWLRTWAELEFVREEEAKANK